MRAAYEAGQTLDEIARASQLSHEGVRYHLLKMGVTMRSRARRRMTPEELAARPRRRVLAPIPIPAWVSKARLGTVYSRITRTEDEYAAAERCRELLALRREGLSA